MTETVLPDVLSEVRGQVGFITLNRPRALNALSLGMVRDLMGILLAWQVDARVLAVARHRAPLEDLLERYPEQLCWVGLM